MDKTNPQRITAIMLFFFLSTLFIFSVDFSFATNDDKFTLENELIRNKIDFSGLKHPNLKKGITSFSILQDDQFFLIAYYVTKGRTLNWPVYLHRLEKKSGKWQTASYSRKDLYPDKKSGGNNGSITQLYIIKDRTYLRMHIGPSYGVTFQLDSELKPNGRFEGWHKDHFPDGIILFQEGMYHGDSGTYLSLFFPATGDTVRIYPPKKPGRAFKEISKVYQNLVDKIIAAGPPYPNYGPDPNNFSMITLDRFLSAETDSLIFIVQPYDTFVLHNYPDLKNKNLPLLVFIYRNLHQPDRIEERDLFLSDLEKRFGKKAISEYLEKPILDELFK